MTVVVDSSMIVALINAEDRFHAEAVAFYSGLDEDLVTTPLAVAELDYVLARRTGPAGVRHLYDDLDSGALQVRWWATAMPETLAIVRELPELGLTDASLVALAPVVRTTRIATFDEHFSAARTAGGHPFTLLP